MNIKGTKEELIYGFRDNQTEAGETLVFVDENIDSVLKDKTRGLGMNVVHCMPDRSLLVSELPERIKAYYASLKDEDVLNKIKHLSNMEKTMGASENLSDQISEFKDEAERRGLDCEIASNVNDKAAEAFFLETIEYKGEKLDVFECLCTNIIAVKRRGFLDVDFYCNFCEKTSCVDVRHTYEDKNKAV